MVTKPESGIVTLLLVYIKSVGGDGWKIHGSGTQRAGEPDLDAWIPHPTGYIHLKIEVKTPTGVASPLQIHRIGVYQRADYCAGIVTSVDELKGLINAYVEKRG